MMVVKRKAGRPQRFKPTAAMRARVQTWVCGLTEDHIAQKLGISTDTLRRYFLAELQFGRASAHAESLEWMRKHAKKGNASLIKAWAAKSAPPPEMTRDPDLVDAPAQAKAKLGKKETAQIVAQTAGEGSEWGEDLQVPGGLPN